MYKTFFVSFAREINELNRAADVSAKLFLQKLQSINGWVNVVVRPIDDERLNRSLALLCELSEAIDNGANDIGGSRGERIILRELVDSVR